MNSSNESVIPLLPCSSYEETLRFYNALGFDVTHQQQAPYLYIAVRRGAVELHFTGTISGSLTKKAMGACLVFVNDVKPYHVAFADGLRTVYGNVPTSELPRLARLRPRHTRFQLLDPSGNSILFINRDEPEMIYDEVDDSQSELEKALVNAEFLRDTYANDKAAARLLDLALERNPSATSSDRARVLAARAELAVAMGDEARFQETKHELHQLALSEEERTRLRDELQAAEELAKWIGLSLFPKLEK